MFKRNQRKRFVISEGDLDAHTRRSLASIPHDNPTESAAAIQGGIEDGKFKLLDVNEDGQRVGFAVYALEAHAQGREFLVVACQGKSKTGDLSMAISAKLEDLAREFGCQTIRLHTMRTGLVKKLTENADWFVSEIVMRKEL